MNRILEKLPALLALCLIMAACAQLGPPLPPSLELPKPPSDLRAIRKGNRVTLYWSEPTLTTDRQSVRYIGPTLICRSLDPEITACGSPAAMLPAPPAVPQKPKSSRGPAQKSDSQHPAPQTYTDTLLAALPVSYTHLRIAFNTVRPHVRVTSIPAKYLAFDEHGHTTAIALHSFVLNNPKTLYHAALLWSLTPEPSKRKRLGQSEPAPAYS